jgi:hypothetical protein
MLQQDVARAAAVRGRLAAGTISPSELARFEQDSRARTLEMETSLRDIVADLAAHRDEPVCIAGLWPQHWALVEVARRMGCQHGLLHPDSAVFGAGGTKGSVMPPDYRNQIYRFYGARHRSDNYGMTELICGFPRCPAGRYHQPPWIKTLVLDKVGERLAAPDAQRRLHGRAAFFDIATAHRWGGVISGDRITLDLRTCPCGRPGPTVLDTISRYSELEGSEDKLSCAGTMEAYVRGVITP